MRFLKWKNRKSGIMWLWAFWKSSSELNQKNLNYTLSVSKRFSWKSWEFCSDTTSITSPAFALLPPTASRASKRSNTFGFNVNSWNFFPRNQTIEVTDFVYIIYHISLQTVEHRVRLRPICCCLWLTLEYSASGRISTFLRSNIIKWASDLTYPKI